MGKKVTQKEIEEKIRKSSGTMSPEADGRVLAAAGEYYRKNPAAMPNPVIAEAANTEDKNNAAVKAANNRTDIKRKRGFGSGSGQRLLVIASAVAACAILAVGILLGVKGLSKKQTVPGTDVSPTIPAEATPALPQKGQWKAGDVTYLSGIAETVFEDPNLVFYEGVNTNNATWTEVLPGYQVYTFPDGITRESAEMYCRKIEQRGFAVYENPQGSTYDYILSGHTSEKEDAREWIVLITVGTPGYVPPERFVDAASDIYSLGLTLKAASFGRQLEDLDKGPSMEADTGAAHFPAWWRILNKATDPTPSRRYQSAKALITDLKSLQLRMSLALFTHSWVFYALVASVAIFLYIASGRQAQTAAQDAWAAVLRNSLRGTFKDISEEKLSSMVEKDMEEIFGGKK